MWGAISALTSAAMARAMATGAVLSAPLLATPCGSRVPTVSRTVEICAGTTWRNSIQFSSSIRRLLDHLGVVWAMAKGAARRRAKRRSTDHLRMKKQRQKANCKRQEAKIKERDT